MIGMSKAKEMLYPVGVENLYLAFMVEGKDSESAIPTYEPEIYSLPTIEKIGIAGNITSANKWASNKLFVNVSKNDKFTLTLDHTAIPVEVMDKVMGVVSTKGITFDNSRPKEFPMFALGFIAPLSDGEKVARWYPKVQVTPPEESFETITEETNIPTQQLVMTATPLLFNDNTKVDYNSARESATGVTAEKFMEQVVCDETELETLFPIEGASS
jgi:phi13 family phage major tail protein